MDKNGQNRGRPGEYKPSFANLVMDYARNPKKYDDPVPTIEGACCEIGISKQTMYRWAKEHPDLSDAVDALKHEQARLLQKYGLLSKTNAVITKLMLSANHGMSEKQGVELTGADGGPVAHSLTVTFK